MKWKLGRGAIIGRTSSVGRNRLADVVGDRGVRCNDVADDDNAAADGLIDMHIHYRRRCYQQNRPHQAIRDLRLLHHQQGLSHLRYSVSNIIR